MGSSPTEENQANCAVISESFRRSRSGRAEENCDQVRGYGRYHSLLMTTGIASHMVRQPGKFHLFGKSRHCWGLTGLIEQFAPSRRIHSPLGFSVRVSPRRSSRSVVKFSTNSSISRFMNRAICTTSSSVMGTSPGHLQQFVHL